MYEYPYSNIFHPIYNCIFMFKYLTFKFKYSNRLIDIFEYDYEYLNDPLFHQNNIYCPYTNIFILI